MVAAITNIDPVELFRWLWRYFIMGAIFVIPAYIALRFVRYCFSGGSEKPIKPSLADPEPLSAATVPSDDGSAFLRMMEKKDNLSAVNRGASSMAARLGHVLGWAGDIVGGLLMLMGAYFGAVGTTDKVTQFLFLFAPGFAIFLIGRACRYVLAGEQEKEKKKRFIHSNEVIFLVAILAAFVGWQLNKGFTMAAIF